MRLFLYKESAYENMSEYDRLFNIIESGNDIEIVKSEMLIEKAIVDLNTVERLGSIDHLRGSTFFEEVEEKKTGIFEGIRKLFESIIKFFRDMFTAMTNKFSDLLQGKRERVLSADEFIKSDMFSLMINVKYEDKLNELDKAMREGHTLIGKIAADAGVNDMTVRKFEDYADGLVKSIPKIVFYTVGAIVAVKGFRYTAKNYRAMVKDLDEKRRAVMHFVDRLFSFDIFKKKADRLKNPSESLSFIKRISVAIKKIGNKHNEVTNGVMGAIDNRVNSYYQEVTGGWS